MIGSLIGNYRLERPLGEGGMGAVYVAEHTLLGRRAALKVLLRHLSNRPDMVQRFFNEARAVTTVNDPGIVQVFDFGFHTDGRAFIVMELLEGDTLDQRLHRVGRFGALEAIRVVRQIATTLAAAHAKGIVHRDLKPENVVLVSDSGVPGGERAKLLDFGIAKTISERSDAAPCTTQVGALMGTPFYMAPEQCRGASDLDHRADIYALGCVLYHLLVGRPPFLGDGLGELIVMHLRETPVPPSAHVAELKGVDALVLRCLAKEPSERFGSMSELVAALDRATGGDLGLGIWSGMAAGIAVARGSLPGLSRFFSTQAPVAAMARTLDATTEVSPRRRAGARAAAIVAALLGVGGAWGAARAPAVGSPVEDGGREPAPTAAGPGVTAPESGWSGAMWPPPPSPLPACELAPRDPLGAASRE